MLPKTGDFRIAPTGGALEGGRRRRGKREEEEKGEYFRKRRDELEFQGRRKRGGDDVGENRLRPLFPPTRAH